MRVIINEIKKILNFKSMLMITAIFFIIWSLFIGSYIEYFPQGLPELPQFNLSQQMLKEYGETIDEEEWESFVNDTKELEREADEYLQNDKEAKDIGITSYREFIARFEKGFNSQTEYKDKVDKIHSRIMFQEENYLFWELENREYLIDRYSQKEVWLSNRSFENNEKQIARMKEVIESEDSDSVFNFAVFRNYNSIIGYFAIIVIITIAFAVSPIFIDDEKSKTNYLQYSSKIGRKLAGKKVIAAMVSSFLVTTVEIIALLIMYSKNNSFQFWNCSINGIFSDITSWFNITFGEYIILTIIILYILAFIVTGISIYVSSRAKTYISLIGIQLPILFIICAFVKALGINEVTYVLFPKYLLHIIYGALIIISSIMMFKVINKEKVKDIA